ncbi:MAG: ParB N-terminal domain-containing protein [Candidatus Treponema excrementipullorum]|nr:ParB N-terminal domain-containing protein [Candidatus Treponema excrementipullorum]
MLIDIDQIKIKNRVRKDLSDLDNLKDSLKRYGLLNPITVTADYNLIAGHRRLEAAKQLGWTTINAIVVPVDDEVTKLEMELEENTQRKDFTDAELLEGYKRLEKLRNPSFFQKLWRKIKDFFSKLFKKQ